MAQRKITVITTEKKYVLNAFDGAILADVLSENGFPVHASCGRRGTCGKCMVKLISGSFINEVPENGFVRSCRAIICDDAVIEFNSVTDSGMSDFKTEAKIKKEVCGIAVDIGTTTVAATLIKKDGTTVSRSRLNPQSSFGADVISRIEACSNGTLPELTRLIRECIKGMIAELDPDNKAEEMIVAGNTTMLHIFCGISPESMGAYPFTPQFTQAKTFKENELGLNIEKVTVLPSVSAFIGSDIVAGIYALGLHKTDKRIILADLGTNGELVFSDRGKLYCTSTAAGPALEGAGIECGIGGVIGAVNRVFSEDNDISYTTIGGEEAIGICGAGLVDAIALLLKKDIVDPSGYLEDDFKICKNVYISPKDIRQFQLAKSAIISGIETLIEAVGININDIDKICTAGGLGFYLDAEKAIIAGLLPRIDKGKIKAVGNTSLQGGLMCIGNGEAVAEMAEIANSCTLLDLGGNADFSQKFMDNMFFN